jgi:hypothetical protein
MLEALGLEHTAKGELEEAAWAFLLGARLALARGDLLRAARCHQIAADAARGPRRLEKPSLIPNLLLVESELAIEAGDAEASARLSARAIAGFKAAGDPDGVIAAWTARAERALVAGNAAAAAEILDVLLPVLDERGGDAPVWLRIRLGASLAAAGRAEAAEAAVADALERTEPGTAVRMAAAAQGMRLRLDAGRARDALAIGAVVLDAPASGAPALHAEVVVLCAVALTVLREPDLAAKFAERAAGFDGPGLAEARQRLEIAGKSSAAGGV